MSVSARESFREARLFDEYSIDSGQPSDEWETGPVDDDRPIDEYDVPEDNNYSEQTDEHSTAHEESTYRGKEPVLFNQSSFVDYLSHLVPDFSVEGSKLTELGRSFSTATYSKFRTTKPETKAKRPGSSHSRCIIENPESIQERQDEHFRDSNKRGDKDGARDQSTMSCSVEEISQISELTMDIPHVVAEQRFAQCSALPTISEVKQFNSPQIAATCASGIRGKAQCSAGTDTTTNKSEGNNDFLDYVFELVEDAMCTPLKTSKSERKKAFMEAFHEESEKVFKLANKNGSKDPFRESSKHSRSSTGTKRTKSRTRNSPSPMDGEVTSATDRVETSTHSRRSDHSRMKIVDKPPLEAPGFRATFPLNEELTMDWSKMMSLAEKQLEDEENSVVSNDSRISEVSGITEKSSLYHSVRCNDTEKHDASVISDKLRAKTKLVAPSIYGTKASIAIDQNVAKASLKSSGSKSSSTHAALADDVVKELRELSALDSSSFEEESRFLLTSTVFRFMGSLVPSFGDMNEKSSKEMEYEERAFDEISVASIPLMLSMDDEEFTCPNEKFEDEEMTLKMIRYIAFFYAFVFWPSGIPRKPSPQQPLDVLWKKRIDSKPTSLLQLVNGK